MKLTAKIKLLPTEAQADSLRRTLTQANLACDHISQVAWDSRTFGRNKLHPKVYRVAKEQFGLSAQMACRSIKKVVDAYYVTRHIRHTFRPLGGIAYDSRILTYKADSVSIWTVDGRLHIPFISGDYQAALLAYQKGETDLVLIRGQFYLCATCDIKEPAPFEPLDVLGVDLGIVNIAVDSDSVRYSGAHLNNLRRRRRKQRKQIQAVGTKSARRKLKKLSGKERRFATHVNHCISKQIVEKAKRTNRAIAMEDLTGIRQRVRVRRSQRDSLHSWAFYQLGGFVGYKAQREGVPKLPIDPRNSSRECAICGCVDKRNRKSQSVFLCVGCGHADHADDNAASVLRNRGRATVNLPIVSTTPVIGLAAPW